MHNVQTVTLQVAILEPCSLNCTMSRIFLNRYALQFALLDCTCAYCPSKYVQSFQCPMFQSPIIAICSVTPVSYCSARRCARPVRSPRLVGRQIRAISMFQSPIIASLLQSLIAAPGDAQGGSEAPVWSVDRSIRKTKALVS